MKKYVVFIFVRHIVNLEGSLFRWAKLHVFPSVLSTTMSFLPLQALSLMALKTGTRPEFLEVIYVKANFCEIFYFARCFTFMPVQLIVLYFRVTVTSGV